MWTYRRSGYKLKNGQILGWKIRKIDSNQKKIRIWIKECTFKPIINEFQNESSKPVIINGLGRILELKAIR